MKFGLHHPNYDFDYMNQNTSQITYNLKKLATSAEKLGFDSFWIMDHLHQIPLVDKPSWPMLESWSILSLLAGITSKIRLGTLMTSIIYRRPSLLAKIASTVNVLSN
jgi:alkanesulfonate monooxygenase SsuD/methylene tetrahydromethanopterin reductase-like flavin-dependent oxidoreductase (luciferase family)